MRIIRVGFLSKLGPILWGQYLPIENGGIAANIA